MYRKEKSSFLLVLGVFIILISLIVPTVLIVNNIQFNQNCGGYLKQAADANTVEIAHDRICKALDYIEKNNLTSGYTSILWKTEDENVGFWYENIKACKNELELCKDASQLEKTNVLMKVRETLTDDGGQDGTILTVPDGISRYPYNTRCCFLMLLSLVFCFGGAFLIYLYND